MPAFRLLAALALPLLAHPVSAAEPAFDGKSLAATLRPLLVNALPSPLSTASMGWGDQREVPIGVKWEKQKLLYKPVPMMALRNDGHWQKVTLSAIDPAKSLTLTIRDVRTTAEKTYFHATVGLDVRGVYEQQMWALAKRLYAGETRVRCRATLDLACELTSTVTFAPKAVLPTIDLRIRATEAKVGYGNVVCEHTFGLDGKPAELMGKAALGVMRAVAPQVERDLLAKANEAVLKAADTKEVRVEFDKLLPRAGK
jgi:hypothetical protein